MKPRAQLVLPLLAELEAAGGKAAPAEIYERLAARVGVAGEDRKSERRYGGKRSRLWDRDVRWARQLAVLRGLVASPGRGVWQLTGEGRTALRLASPGAVVLVFEAAGGAALWATAEAAASAIEPGSVDLIFTSPPYPIATARSYGGIAPDEWIDWMAHLAGLWAGLLSPAGSLMVNMGYTYARGEPVQSLYPERFALRMVDELGWHLADRLFWHNPNKLPSPMPWVAVDRVRCKPSVEPVYWFARTTRPQADNRAVLVPYAARTRAIELGRKQVRAKRASGYGFGPGSFARDNGGAIPPNLIVASNAASQAAWRRKARAGGESAHPAPFPVALPERAILLTTRPGDLVYDPLAGSGTTAEAAARHGRRWITSERALDYVRGSALRFDESPDFRRHGI